jgi:alkylhydroperoxidase family enzyme
VLDDWRTAAINEKLRAMLGFLEKLTLSPNSVKPEDIVPLRAVGLSEEAIEDAIYVCAYFNLIDRLADSFEFGLLDAEGYGRSAVSLLSRGYQ